MASIADLIAASTDTDLRARVRAAADARGLPLNWTDLHMGRLVATELDSMIFDAIDAIAAEAV